MFFFDSKKEPRQSRADAKNYSFFCKKRKQKNINNRNLKLNNYGLGNFLKFTLFSNGNYIPLIQNIKFYLYSLFNYFEIISRFFMTFYIIVVDFTDYIITNYLLKNSLLKVFSLNYSFEKIYFNSSFNNFYLNYSKEFSFNYLNSFLNFGVMNNFVKLNDFVNGHLRNDFLFNTKNQKKF